jgi:hypothetical protein
MVEVAANETIRVFSFWTDDDVLAARIRVAPESVPSTALDLTEGATVELRVMEDADEPDCEPWTQLVITNGAREMKLDMDAHTARTLGAMLCAATLEQDVKIENCQPPEFDPPLRISMERQLRRLERTAHAMGRKDDV